MTATATAPRNCYDVERACDTARRLMHRLGRRPLGKELIAGGVHIGHNTAWGTATALLIKADLVHPTPTNPRGLTAAEEASLRTMVAGRMWRREICHQLGIVETELTDEIHRLGLTVNVRNRSAKKSEQLRRCYGPDCYQLTVGLEPCQHCGTPLGAGD